jgi:hypothetical protein
MPSDNFINYFRSQQVSLQWLPVLRALALELSASADAAGLRQLFFKVGERFAKDVEERFQDVQTLAELEEYLNEFWAQLNWGWVHFSESKGAIDIEHQAAPLAEAFGDESLVWSVGLLEGFYQTVFIVLGAGNTMKVAAVDEACRDMTVQLCFSHRKL